VQLYKNLFFMKAVYLFFDGILIVSIMQYIKDKGARITAFKLWCINPVLLFGAYMFGQFDIMPAALVVLSLVFMGKNNKWWGFFFLSAAALLKTYPLFIIFPFLIIETNSKRDAIINCSAIALPWLVFFVPLYFLSDGYVMNSIFPKFYFVNSADLIWMNVRKVVFLFLYMVLLKECVVQKKRTTDLRTFQLTIATAVIMLVYTLFFVPIHYFIWVTPLLIILVAEKRIPKWVYWSLISCLFLYSFNSRWTTVTMFSPVAPKFFLNLPSLPDMMHMLSIKWGVVMLAAELVFICIYMGLIAKLLGIFDRGRFFLSFRK